MFNRSGEIIRSVDVKRLPSYRGLPRSCVLSRLGQPKFQDQLAEFFFQLRIATDEVEECGVANVEGGEALAGGECSADAVYRSLE